MRTDTFVGHGSATVQRVLEAELARARARGTDHPRVIDAGGGSGGWAVPFAVAGCLVTVVEPNPNALATLRRRADEEGVAGRITPVADDAEALGGHVTPHSADLVLAHGLLEVVDDPVAAVAALSRALNPEGALSVLAANLPGVALQRALGGKFAQARMLLLAEHGVLAEDGETLLRRYDRAGLESLLAGAGLKPAEVRGDGVVSEAVQVPNATPAVQRSQERDDELTEFEVLAAGTSPLREIAARVHILARHAVSR